MTSANPFLEKVTVIFKVLDDDDDGSFDKSEDDMEEKVDFGMFVKEEDVIDNIEPFSTCQHLRRMTLREARRTRRVHR